MMPLIFLPNRAGQSGRATRGSDHKASHQRRGRAPQPTLLTGLLPAGFIDVLDVGLLHCFLSFGVSVGQCQRSFPVRAC